MLRSKCRTTCAMRGCTTSYARLPEGVKLVSFARDERLPKWVEAVKGKGSDWLPSKHTMICTLHFAPKYFKPDYKTRREWLLPGAIPYPVPQLPPDSMIVRKHIPNSNAYLYSMKKDIAVPGPVLQDLSFSQQQHQKANLEDNTTAVHESGVSVLKNAANTTPRIPNSDEILTSRTPKNQKGGVSISKNTLNPKTGTPHSKKSSASLDSALSGGESSAADRITPLRAQPITPQAPQVNVCESLALTSSTPTSAYSESLLDGPNCSVLPCPSPSSSAFPAHISETPPKAARICAPVAVCLDVEENDSPCTIALKQTIMHLENQYKKSQQQYKDAQAKLELERKRHATTRRKLDALKVVKKVENQYKKSQQQYKDAQAKLELERKRHATTRRKLDALKVVKKGNDFNLSCYSIDAPSHWGDRAVVWHAHP